MYRGEPKRPATRHRGNSKHQSSQNVASPKQASDDRSAKSNDAQDKTTPPPAKLHGDKFQPHIPESPQTDEHAPLSDPGGDDASDSAGAHA